MVQIWHGISTYDCWKLYMNIVENEIDNDEVWCMNDGNFGLL